MHMKILFVSTDFNRSGAALAMIELAEKIQQFGNEVLLLYPGYGNAVEEAEKRGLPQKVIRSYEWVKPLERQESWREKIKWFLKHAYNIISILRIEHLIKQEDIDIVHNNTLWGYVGPVAARRTKTPYVWHMRELLEQQQQQLRWKKFGENLISDADALVAISKLVENNYDGRFPKEKIHLIYDGVDIDKMYRTNHSLFVNQKIRMIIVGGIRPPKRQMDVVLAIKILLEKGVNIELNIVGDDKTTYADDIKKYIHLNGLEERIKICGETDNVVSYWAESDISVTASEFEAFGRVTAEAMLTGCVVIVSNSGANEEIISDGVNGFVYELGNSESLAETIEKVINDKEKAHNCAITGRKSVVQRFSSEENAKQVVCLYKKILEKKTVN